MGAYSNPGEIQADQSGAIISQALTSLSQNFLSFAQNKAAQQEQAAKEQKEENDRLQKIGYEIEEAYYDAANANYEILQEKNPALTDQFKTMTGQLLDGVGVPGEEGYQMGAIEAQTILATKGDLSKEERQKYRKIVQRAKAFQDRVISGGESIMADLADLEKIKPQDIGNTHFYIGNTLEERLTSEYSAAVLANKPIPGAKTNKTLKSDEDGLPIVSVTTEFDVESDAGKQLLQKFPKLKDKIKDGKISFNWERSVDKLGDGFIGEIPKGADAIKTFADTGATDKQDKLTSQMFIGTPQSRRESSNAAGIDNLITETYINTPGLAQDKIFKAQINATVQGLISNDPGHLQSYMQNTLELGPNFDYEGFMKLSADEKTAFLTAAESDRVIKTRLSGYDKRLATAEDVAYINENARQLSGDGNIIPIKEGDLIYVEKKITQVNKYKGGGSGDEKKNVLSKTDWESFKKSNYRKGNYIYKWDQAAGVFKEYRLTQSGDLELERETGNVASSPQELGNLTNQNIDNYSGFEPVQPITNTSEIGPFTLETAQNRQNQLNSLNTSQD